MTALAHPTLMRASPSIVALSQLTTTPGEVARLRRHARDIVAAIAGQTPSDPRASCLALPAVRAVADP